MIPPHSTSRRLPSRLQRHLRGFLHPPSPGERGPRREAHRPLGLRLPSLTPVISNPSLRECVPAPPPPEPPASNGNTRATNRGPHGRSPWQGGHCREAYRLVGRC